MNYSELQEFCGTKLTQEEFYVFESELNNWLDTLDKKHAEEDRINVISVDKQPQTVQSL